MLSKEFIEDLKNYLDKNGYSDGYIHLESISGGILTGYVWNTRKGEMNGLGDRWKNEFEETARYFLEYIGSVLRKHNIKEIKISHSGDKTFYSSDWKFNNIKTKLIEIVKSKK